MREIDRERKRERERGRERERERERRKNVCVCVCVEGGGEKRRRGEATTCALETPLKIMAQDIAFKVSPRWATKILVKFPRKRNVLPLAGRVEKHVSKMPTLAVACRIGRSILPTA